MGVVCRCLLLGVDVVVYCSLCGVRCLPLFAVCWCLLFVGVCCWLVFAVVFLGGACCCSVCVVVGRCWLCVV